MSTRVIFEPTVTNALSRHALLMTGNGEKRKIMKSISQDQHIEKTLPGSLPVMTEKHRFMGSNGPLASGLNLAGAVGEDTERGNVKQCCSKCGEIKPMADFPLRKKSKTLRAGFCKICRNRYDKEWRKKNPDREKLKCSNWRTRKRLGIIGHKRIWISKPPTVSRKERRDKIKNRPDLKLNRSISAGVNRSLRGGKQGRSWEQIVGYTAEKLKKHLEKKFKPGMTWENYGSYWHVDHKIPVSAFNFNKPEDLDFKRCWALKNLQPLEATVNIIKSNRLDLPFQPSLRIATG